MTEILRVTVEGQASSEQMRQANTDLSGLAEDLQEVVESFRLEAEAQEQGRVHG
jgi:methyl-accepting chemotaxis protein